MTTLDNLGAHTDGVLIAQSQSQKEVTSNALDNLLSNATQKPLTVVVTLGSPAEFNLTDDQFFGNFVFDLTGSLGEDFDLKVPPGGAHFFAVENNTNRAATPKAAASGSDTVAAGKRRIFHSDGTTVIALGPEHSVAGGGGGSGASTQFFADLDAWFAGSPSENQTIRRWVVTRKISLPADFEGSQAYLSTAPADGPAVFELHHDNNGSPTPEFIGTMTFALGAKTATFANTGSPGSAVMLNPGDLLELRAPAGSPQDSALADISVRLKGDGGFRGAMAMLTSAFSVANASATPIDWDTTEYDTDSSFSGSNPSRLTVPPGVTRVRLVGGVFFASDTDTAARNVSIRKNGSTVQGGGLVQTDNGGSTPGNTALNVSSAVLSVVGGDYFELFARQDSGGALDVTVSDFTFFGIEVVE
jgi:hypothetical protein